jgi:hypothetical protein
MKAGRKGYVRLSSNGNISEEKSSDQFVLEIVDLNIEKMCWDRPVKKTFAKKSEARQWLQEEAEHSFYWWTFHGIHYSGAQEAADAIENNSTIYRQRNECRGYDIVQGMKENQPVEIAFIFSDAFSLRISFHAKHKVSDAHAYFKRFVAHTRKKSVIGVLFNYGFYREDSLGHIRALAEDDLLNSVRGLRVIVRAVIQLSYRIGRDDHWKSKDINVPLNALVEDVSKQMRRMYIVRSVSPFLVEDGKLRPVNPKTEVATIYDKTLYFWCHGY